MSRFESSRFVRNPQIMNANVLMAACETLGWKYSLQNNILLVTEVGNDSNFHGEFALRLDEKNGFTYRSNYTFTPTEEERFSFYMEAKSYDPLEDEPFASIKFTILKDGTIITDSDYLPNDVNEKAHEAMDILEQHLGNKRVMTKKPVPAKYLSKMKPRRTINLNQNS